MCFSGGTSTGVCRGICRDGATSRHECLGLQVYIQTPDRFAFFVFSRRPGFRRTVSVKHMRNSENHATTIGLRLSQNACGSAVSCWRYPGQLWAPCPMGGNSFASTAGPRNNVCSGVAIPRNCLGRRATLEVPSTSACDARTLDGRARRRTADSDTCVLAGAANGH